MGTNDATNWEKRLKGEIVPLTSDMEPDYGFYRVRTKDKTSWRAMAYWYDDAGKLHCFLQGRGELPEEQAREIWSWASRNPITHELYKAVVERDEPWPDLNTEVTRLHNNPPQEETFDTLRDAIDNLVRDAERVMKGGAAKSQEEADSAADLVTKLRELSQSAENKRVVEKQPHLDKCREVDAKWGALKTAAAIYSRLNQIVCAPWLAAKAEEKRQAEAKAKAEADQAAQAALRAMGEASRKAAEAEKTGDATVAAAAQRAQDEAQAAARTAMSKSQNAQAIGRATVTAGTRGKTVHLRADDVFTVEDRIKVIEYLVATKNEKALKEVDEVLTKYGKALRKAGAEVPGIKVTEGSKAA